MKITKNSAILFSGTLLLLVGFFLIPNKSSNILSKSLSATELKISNSNESQNSSESLLKPTESFEIRDSSATQSEKPNQAQILNSPPDSKISQLSDHEKSTWDTFETILNSKNDNDPRVNQELLNLSENFHEALFEKYDSISTENRNARGLVVFLVARDLKTKEDLEFLTKVYQEPPCLSLDDCKNAGSDDPHHAGINQTTLIYPQLVGLYQLEQKLTKYPQILKDPIQRNGIISLLKQAEDFPVPAVQQKAQDLRRKFNL